MTGAGVGQFDVADPCENASCFLQCDDVSTSRPVSGRSRICDPVNQSLGLFSPTKTCPPVAGTVTGTVAFALNATNIMNGPRSQHRNASIAVGQPASTPADNCPHCSRIAAISRRSLSAICALRSARFCRVNVSRALTADCPSFVPDTRN